jgi:hypothetical protein
MITLALVLLEPRIGRRRDFSLPWSLGVTPRGDEHIDDLTELVDRSIDVAPLSRHLHIRLVDLPAVTEGVPARTSGVGQQRCEAQHPPVDRDVVDLDTALGA